MMIEVKKKKTFACLKIYDKAKNSKLRKIEWERQWISTHITPFTPSNTSARINNEYANQACGSPCSPMICRTLFHHREPPGNM